MQGDLMSTNSGTVRTTRRRLQAVDTRGGAHDSSDSVPSLTAALPRLAAALDEAAENEGWGRPPRSYASWPGRPSPLTEGFDLGVRPLDSEMSVVEALCGFTAPTEWLAIGVVTEGNARHLDDPGFEQRRVRCVHLVDRSGASGSTLRLHGEAATVLSSLDDHDPGGRVDDVCRLALGLPTAAPRAQHGRAVGAHVARTGHRVPRVCTPIHALRGAMSQRCTPRSHFLSVTTSVGEHRPRGI